MQHEGPAEAIADVAETVKGAAKDAVDAVAGRSDSSPQDRNNDRTVDTESGVAPLSPEEKPGGPLPVEPHVSHGLPE